MFSSDSLSPPSRGLRVNINDLLNPIRPSGAEHGSPSRQAPSPSSPPIRAHTQRLPGFDSLGELPRGHPSNDQRYAQYGPPARLREEQSRSRRTDGQRIEDAELSETRLDSHHSEEYSSSRSTQWMPTRASTGDPRLALPPLQPVREFKVEPWQMGSFPVSPPGRQYTRDAGYDSSMHRSSAALPSPSSASSSSSSHSISPVAGFATSHFTAAPTMMAIPHSPYGHQQHRPLQASYGYGYGAPPATLGPHAHAHHPHLSGRLPVVGSVHSPVMSSSVPPPKNEYNASSTAMVAEEPSATELQLVERASVRLAARGTKTPTPAVTNDEPAPVLQLHPTDHSQQIGSQRKRTHSNAGLNNQSGTSSASRSSSLSLSSQDSVANGDGGPEGENESRTKKVRGKTKVVDSLTADPASTKDGNASQMLTGSQEIANGPSRSSKKGKQKEKVASAPSHGYPNGHLQPFDSQMTVQLGYGVGVVPVREGVAMVPYGYAPYPVPMHIHPLGLPVQVASGQNQPFATKWFPELQYARCMSARYKADPFPRCVSCTRRWAGDTCRFQNIRILLRDSNKTLWAVGFQDLSAKTQGPHMVYPDKWNVPLEKRHIDRTMETVARSLLMHLRKEQAHQRSGSVVRRQRETDVRATCDTCMTSLFSSSWMCRQCGREACEECYETIRRLTAEPTPAAVAAANGKAKVPASPADQRIMKERHAQANPFFLACNRKAEHGVHTFVPVTRFAKSELDKAVAEMSSLVEQGDESRQNAQRRSMERDDNRQLSAQGGVEGDAERTTMEVDLPQSSAIQSNSESSSQPKSNSSLELIPEHYNDGICTLIENPIQPRHHDYSFSSSLPPTATTPLETPTWPVPYYTAETLTETVFAAQWARGTPLVVTGLLDRLNLHWTPEYFMKTYGGQPCIILECQTDGNKKVTVGEFFSYFGKYEGRTECWKLKDWPPSTDFKTAFPELYDDFNRVLPVPSYTRRDGAYNISSHFPTNTIAPDLGPKMYNAYASTDAPGSKGSTRLHMDMADAVNIMVHSELTVDGAPGCAAWDIFRAEDSGHLRSFFKKNFKGKYQNDAIHAQHFYLDPTLRAQLYAEYGVRSFRIYQRPGEAVFIPAGCAHQVCNLSDSIKVACDFVSPENVERCETLTREFRAQNQSLVWKEDVLQLRSMMWFSWLSCREQQEKRKGEDLGLEFAVAQTSISNEAEMDADIFSGENRPQHAT